MLALATYFKKLFLPLADALLLGGFRCVRRLMEERVLDRPATLAFLIGVFVLIASVHVFAGWLSNLLQNREHDGQSVRWRFRWSVAFVALVMTFFLAGICAVGIAHQMTWMLTDTEGL